jgi:hypothetical protein
MQRMQEISSAVMPRVQTGRLPPDGTRLVQGMDAQGNEEMKNLIKLETAVVCTECGLSICVWIEKVLRPLAIGGGVLLLTAMIIKEMTR